MDVSLSKEEVIALYANVREADRSLHFLLNPAKTWIGFLEYYHSEKRDRLARFLDQLERGLSSTAAQAPQPRTVSFWRFWWECCFASRRRRWMFASGELNWMIAQCRAFLYLLDCSEQPSVARLIDQRQKLRDVQTFLEHRCVGMSELKSAEAVGHFDQLVIGASPPTSGSASKVA